MDVLRFFSLNKEESNGPWRYLRRNARIVTSDFEVNADEIDYNSDTNWAFARGHVHLEHFVTGEKLDCSRAEYNLETQMGKYYEISGTSPAKIVASPAVLTTTNPFYFKAQWAERIKTRYILHHGFLTDCQVERPWWRFRSPVFDVVPGQRAIARNTVFLLKGIPVFYLPYFYRPLGKKDRQSGFLTPSIGNSSRYGYVVGGGYYWAINRSYDMTGFVQDYTSRGPAIRYDFRGKPNARSDFDFNLYSVIDGGLRQADGSRVKQGGTEFEVTARTNILGFTGFLDFNYLSSYLFRQTFSYSLTSAVTNEIFSTGDLQRHFKQDRYTVNILFQRDQLFNSVTPLNQPADRDVVQKLPSLEFLARDQPLWRSGVPLWWSVEGSANVETRSDPTGAVDVRYGRPRSQSSGAFSRADVEPRVYTAFSWKGFSLIPSIAVGSTSYSESYRTNQTLTPSLIYNVTLGGGSLWRKNADAAVDFRTPSLEKIYIPPKWLHLGSKVKHVIEADAKYEYVTGLADFNRVIRIDTRDILSNTNQVTLGVTNRILRKNKSGQANEIVKWRVAYARYFDPTFGGAVLPNQRNVVFASEEFSPYAFLDGRRLYSPISSTLTITPSAFFSLDWRSEYDPKLSRFIDHNVAATFRRNKLFGSFGDQSITTDPIQVPATNQINFGGGWGSTNGKGVNAAAIFYYDVILNRRIFSFYQTSYNTDCCGFSLQVRQYNLGIRNENQYLFSFSLANIGNFGSLSRQTRIF